MQTTARFGTASRAILLLALLALLLAAFATIGVASQPSLDQATAVGAARNGLIAYPLDGDIWAIEPDGSDPRVLVSTPGLEGPPVWSPDGTRIAFRSLEFDGDPNDTDALLAAMQDNDAWVWVANADGSGARTLMQHVKWPSNCGTNISWSHDGDRLAVSHLSVDDGATPLISILSLDGEPARTLVEGGVDPVWSPDDGTIAYHGLDRTDRDGSAGSAGVWLIGADGSDPRQISRTSGSGCAFDGPDWSPDGTTLVFQGAGDGPSKVWVAAADGSGETAIATGQADDTWPRWSPDGSSIVFERVNPADGVLRLVVSDPDGGVPRELDHQQIAGRPPVWAPDGRSIIGILLDEAQTKGIGFLQVDPAGVEEPIELYRGPVGGDPSWQRLAP